jgi:predicted RNA methylase
VKFAILNQKYLKGRKFKNTLELGSGTGIQLICFANLSEKLTGVDINPRAVDFTKVSAQLNGLGDRFTVLESDLFEKLEGKYDVIIANPWFIDIEKGGLEEIPDITKAIDTFMEDGGLFTMYFSSYVKDGVDLGKELLTGFAKENGYQATLYGLGKSIEPQFLHKYKQHNISHINNYYALLEKNGKGTFKVVSPSIARRIRDSFYIPLQKLIKKSAYDK